VEGVRPASFDEYRDLSWRARLARGWLVVVLALTILSAILEGAHLNILSDAGAARLDLALAERLDASNARLGLVYIADACAMLLCAVFFIAWTYRAYKNAFALGAQQPRFKPWWAIGGWLIPIVWLWRPKQIVDDVWRTSDPAAPALVPRSAWRRKPIPALLVTWWILFVVSSLVDWVSSRLPTVTIAQERTASSWSLVASLLDVQAALLAIWLVTRLTKRQRQRAAALAALPADGPSAALTGSPPTAATARGS
jgi:hypothetical protein